MKKLTKRQRYFVYRKALRSNLKQTMGLCFLLRNLEHKVDQYFYAQTGTERFKEFGFFYCERLNNDDYFYNKQKWRRDTLTNCINLLKLQSPTVTRNM